MKVRRARWCDDPMEIIKAAPVAGARWRGDVSIRPHWGACIMHAWAAEGSPNGCTARPGWLADAAAPALGLLASVSALDNIPVPLEHAHLVSTAFAGRRSSVGKHRPHYERFSSNKDTPYGTYKQPAWSFCHTIELGMEAYWA